MKRLLVMLLLLPLPTYANDYLFAAGVALHTIDWGQTRDIERNPDISEGNIVIRALFGRNPTPAQVDAYFLITGVTLTWAFHKIDKGKRIPFGLAWISQSLITVSANKEIGLEIRF